MSGFKQEDAMVDFTQYFNMDQAASASQAQKGKTTVSPHPYTAPGPENAFIPPPHMSQQYQAPSHNYDMFRQHSGLPPGAMQTAMQRPRHVVQGMGTNALFDINEDSNLGMDVDFSDFLNGGSSLDGYVDPSSVGSDMGDASPVAAPVQRLYPGIHQQAAKAQQEQQRRLQEQQQQQKALQQQKAQAQQQQPAHPHGHQRRQSQGRNKSVDPVVEERISQILKQMRNSSQNSRPTDAETPQPTHSSIRSKKDEEDMDEDERLLASEEGKKLSSKERRQLRNKVSARAFRSRRKEYISQLEGEINGKNQENDDLRYDNEVLRGENAQLTDLARMLLGHPAFSTVLEDLSSRGAQMPFLPPQTQPQQLQPQQQSQHRASIAMSQTSTQGSGSQSNAMDFATPMDGWNTGASAPDFNFNPSVYAVSEVPEHPAIAPEILAGKSFGTTLPILPSFAEKEIRPLIERPSQAKPDRPVLAALSEFEGSDDLYAALPAPVSRPELPAAESHVLAPLSPKKAIAGFQLVDAKEVKDLESVFEARFDAIADRLDELSLRVSSISGHL